MIKITLAVTGIAVPALASFKLVEGIESIEKSIGSVSRNAGSLLDHAIKSVESRTKNHHDLATSTSTSNNMDFTALKPLEGPDLRKLESFLRTRDENRALGNLSRTTTTDGHVKWVCNDHYHESCRQRLEELVNACGGYIVGGAHVKIKLISNTVAKAFYQEMVKVPDICTLYLELMWSVTQKDLQALVDAVAKMGEMSLAINYSFSKKHPLDIALRKSMIVLIPNLHNLTLRSQGDSVKITISQGKIQDVQLTILSDVVLSDGQSDGLSHPQIPQSTVEMIKSHLGGTLGFNSKLSSVLIKVLPEHGINIVRFMVAELGMQKGLDPSNTQSALNITIQWRLNNTAKTEVVLDFSADSVEPSISTSVQMGPLEVSSGDPGLTRHYLELFREFGWSITTLKTNVAFTDELAYALDVATQERGSKIMELVLNQFPLSSSGLESMDRVIERSQDLVRFGYYLFISVVETESQKTKHILDRHHENIHAMIIGLFTYKLLPDIFREFRTRRDFPKLDTFHFNQLGPSWIPLTHEYARWITDMVSAPHEQTMTGIIDLGSEAPRAECVLSSVWEPLRQIGLRGLQLQHEDWSMVIKAIDFRNLKTLDLSESNFSVREFELMVDCIPVQANRVDTLIIIVLETDVARYYPTDAVHEKIALLQEKAPGVCLRINNLT
ncbi:hypothetical protein BGX31_001954 [Mortierella sp. GBA43]|nr:hypothetical protein BGX31_001954 [Mortierella sp. GBA43]